MTTLVDRLRELEAAATPGPWHADDLGEYSTLTYADAALIAAMRNVLPALLDLRDYATHVPECAFARELWDAVDPRLVRAPCDCGFDAVLAKLDEALP